MDHPIKPTETITYNKDFKIEESKDSILYFLDFVKNNIEKYDSFHNFNCEIMHSMYDNKKIALHLYYVITNPNYETEMKQYVSDCSKFEEYKKESERKIIENKEIEKKALVIKNKKREVRCIKNLLLNAVKENNTVEIDNKKYKVQLIEIEE